MKNESIRRQPLTSKFEYLIADINVKKSIK
jgi:hypothetical protein